jgi:Site-specific recombinase XerD
LSHYDGKPSAQNYAYAAYRAFLNWCLDQEYIDKHPLLRGKPPNKTRSRSRVLTDEELVRVWRATEDNAYGRMVRLMILTGQRREEVRRLKPEDVADDLITFHTKGDNLNVLPLSVWMRKELILPFRFNNWSNSLAKLQAEARVEDFTHHDLRRTFATNLARLGIHDIVIERALGHTIENVKYTYNRYSYLPDLRDALLTYENHLARLLIA